MQHNGEVTTPGATLGRRRAPGRETWFLCSLCRQRITSKLSELSFDGAHRHQFTNPHGFSFAVALFDWAEGITAAGARTDHFSWFVGYEWEVQYCAGCSQHLGWYFQCLGSPLSGEPPDFFALVLAKLVQT